jgi:hypothetical protein
LVAALRQQTRIVPKDFLFSAPYNLVTRSAADYTDGVASPAAAAVKRLVMLLVVHLEKFAGDARDPFFVQVSAVVILASLLLTRLDAGERQLVRAVLSRDQHMPLQ